MKPSLISLFSISFTYLDSRCRSHLTFHKTESRLALSHVSYCKIKPTHSDEALFVETFAIRKKQITSEEWRSKLLLAVQASRDHFLFFFSYEWDHACATTDDHVFSVRNFGLTWLSTECWWVLIDLKSAVLEWKWTRKEFRRSPVDDNLRVSSN